MDAAGPLDSAPSSRRAAARGHRDRDAGLLSGGEQFEQLRIGEQLQQFVEFLQLKQFLGYVVKRQFIIEFKQLEFKQLECAGSVLPVIAKYDRWRRSCWNNR